MDYNKTRALLAKYWACETTEEEEAQLRQFFATHTDALPEDLREAAPMFQYFHAAANMELDMPELDESLFTEQVIETKTAKIIRPFWQDWMKVAAVITMAFGLGYSISQFETKKETVALRTDTYDDPQKAFEETQRALKLIAKNMNKGTRQMEKLAYFNEATEKVRDN
ncbi:hypothetical protein MKQ70_08975 [Chitinophaga sedimenti]|uniref:hypothetical protein n=1 Tax=Chitinophaga sedimenti TaxID=2033606 RepID=UPI00200429A1|nr:hypothetical protein [Chitinophaga sedimenti]MCK7555132.1 hypothetical protein [Chitinophaga sedimenti]